MSHLGDMATRFGISFFNQKEQEMHWGNVKNSRRLHIMQYNGRFKNAFATYDILVLNPE